MKRISSLIGIALVIAAVGMNLWMYRTEPSALVDPNDNTFQFALVERTNQIWDYAGTQCSGLGKPVCMMGYLSDHWVPNWAEGYNLPFYYSHVPQILIVASFRLLTVFGWSLSLFSWYHWVTYLLLSAFPVSVYLALTIIGLSPIAAGFGALMSANISTDGLYGLDPSSFLWRGYGLSSQLYAMIPLPLALAYAWRLLFTKTRTKRTFLYAVLMLAATTAGHLGIGIITFISIGIIAISPTIVALVQTRWNQKMWQELQTHIRTFGAVYLSALMILGYWILPILRYGNYHNTSVWDPIWKFNSYGFADILTKFFDGALFDFGRLPILTFLACIGMFTAAWPRKDDDDIPPYAPFVILFAAWMLLYFGTTTWGTVLYLIPGMRDFHLSRFIVGVHIAGIFLIPIALAQTVPALLAKLRITRSRGLTVGMTGCALLLAYGVYPQTISYASYNKTLIAQANTNASKQSKDMNTLMTKLAANMRTEPGRVLAGRGGSWGKQLMFADTPYYMHLSTYGIPTVLWLPETWSPNSDTEQYFRDNIPADYDLYNIRYVVIPTDLPKDQIRPFWEPLAASDSWKLYAVPTTGYITTGTRPAIVSVAKDTFLNVVRLWIQSDTHNQRLYPELTFHSNYPRNEGLPNFRMIDEAEYQVPDGSIHNLFTEPPRYVPPDASGSATVISQSGVSDMEFRASVRVPEQCAECIVILKQSFHPSWTATIDGKTVHPFSVFPFYTAIRIDTPGTHDVVFTYRPSPTKMLLLLVAVISTGFMLWNLRPSIRRS